MSLLLKSGRDEFTHTTKFLGDDDLVFAKGVYPYSYMSGPEKFTETQLPPIEAFCNTLEDDPCPVQNYNRAREIWAHYNIKTVRDYHDHYLLSDVLLLANVFENFRNLIYYQHHLDPLHFITLPLLACSSALIKECQTGPHNRPKHVAHGGKQHAGRNRDHLGPPCSGQ